MARSEAGLVGVQQVGELVRGSTSNGFRNHYQTAQFPSQLSPLEIGTSCMQGVNKNILKWHNIIFYIKSGSYRPKDSGNSVLWSDESTFKLAFGKMDIGFYVPKIKNTIQTSLNIFWRSQNTYRLK